MRQFVPMTDELLDDPASLPGPLVPYRCGVPCWHRLQASTLASREHAPGPAAPSSSDEHALSASPSSGLRA